ncbi:peptidoglycan-binding domain-containing protein [Streptomyces sp. NBC_01298]|uniref:peptidoglycan-binding domain-containing protein n=1 Tax=Streptomyces sp. NBC_01298 TaxID=2903817 RepID=UPI002E107431|nr:peptidoglycan-binding domain-containing protein [Streptomyces sp. NBC_01298]
MNLRKQIMVTVATAVLGGGLALGGVASAAPVPSEQSAAYTCNYYSGTALTTTGQTGSEAVKRIKQVQCLINQNTSYPTWLTEDGQFGSATYNAVKSVQSHAGISVDGQVGPNTWSKLRAGVWW